MKRFIAIILLLLMISLSACCKPIAQVEYVKQPVPELPSEPTYFNVQWLENVGLYCVDASNAKNLLKNIEIEKAYGNDLKAILDGLKE